MEYLLDKVNKELELFNLHQIPLGLKEIYKSVPQQVHLPRELLDWTRQFYIEGRRAGFSSHTLEKVIRTKAIEMYYSVQQVEQVIERVHLELMNSSKAQQFKLISRN
jgi:hypothetical protein